MRAQVGDGVGVPARLGRRRLDGGGARARARARPGAAAPAAHRQRPDAQGREPRSSLRAFADLGLGPAPRLRRRERPLPRARSRDSSSPSEAAGHRRHLHRGVRARGARGSASRDHLLGQGTIYPDTIETGGTKRADTIKTHHNRVPIIQEMIAAGRVVEPLAELYKVEVRELGERLGVPADWSGATRSRARAWACGSSARRACRTATDFDAIEPAVAAVAGRFAVEALAAADPLGGRQGRPALLRAPGAAVGRARRGAPCLEVAGHDLQGRARHQPLPLEPRARGRRAP